VELCEAAIAECDRHGERWHKGEALAALSVICWQRGEADRATELAREGLRIEADFESATGMAHFLEILGWIAATTGQLARAAQQLGAADGIWHAIDAAPFPYVRSFRADAEQKVRRILGVRAFEVEYQAGYRRPQTASVAAALDEPEPAAAEGNDGTEALTPREREIAELVAAGLSNKDIAAKLVISPRTAEGHIEHILSKLGFTSRAQVAVWAAERRGRSGDA
jgi:DNA-binding NarL/FixJ family response regulator